LIVDTSALIAIAKGEPGWEELRTAINMSVCVVPAPVVTELQIVMAGRLPGIDSDLFIAGLIANGATIAAFEQRHSGLTAKARERYGKGNGCGGLLNFGDLMVYAIAKQRDEPVLCTGRDFASTDLEIHPASRLDP